MSMFMLKKKMGMKIAKLLSSQDAWVYFHNHRIVNDCVAQKGIITTDTQTKDSESQIEKN